MVVARSDWDTTEVEHDSNSVGSVLPGSETEGEISALLGATEIETALRSELGCGEPQMPAATAME